jgi:hypothetical protein
MELTNQDYDVEIVYYDKLIDKLITMTSDLGTITGITLSIFENERLEYIGTIEGAL